MSFLERVLGNEPRRPDYFEHVELESSFDEIKQAALQNGTLGSEAYLNFGYVRWLHMNRSVDHDFFVARVGGLKREDGSEEVFTFKGELEDLVTILGVKNAEGAVG